MLCCGASAKFLKGLFELGASERCGRLLRVLAALLELGLIAAGEVGIIVSVGHDAEDCA